MHTLPDKPTDGFTRDFDSLVDLPGSVESYPMGQLKLVYPNAQSSAFDLDFLHKHTTDHQNCPACQAANEALQVNSADLAGMLFADASRFWMLLRRQSNALKPRTHETTQCYLDALNKFFGQLRLCDITPGHVRSYQIARQHNIVRTADQETHPWQRPAGDSIINHEICALGMMMKRARLWHRIKPYYFPKSMPNWSPREILTEEEEEKLWKIASQHPEAALAYWVATITNNTGAAGLELRGLRLKHLFLRGPEEISEIYIPEDSVKNNSRPRKLPLNAPAAWAIGKCYKRALQLGACEPEHFLFPFRVKRNSYDPMRPPSRWFLRKSWEKLVEVTGFSRLHAYDLRHHFATKLLESDVSIETVQAIMGHMHPKMTQYYAHQRRRVKYAAVVAIEPKKKKAPATEKAAGALNRKAG